MDDIGLGSIPSIMENYTPYLRRGILVPRNLIVAVQRLDQLNGFKDMSTPRLLFTNFGLYTIIPGIYTN